MWLPSSSAWAIAWKIVQLLWQLLIWFFAQREPRRFSLHWRKTASFGSTTFFEKWDCSNDVCWTRVDFRVGVSAISTDWWICGINIQYKLKSICETGCSRRQVVKWTATGSIFFRLQPCSKGMQFYKPLQRVRAGKTPQIATRYRALWNSLLYQENAQFQL